MKERFKWYLSPSSDEIKQIWENGVLTVDANLLLDLYRYHAKTREEIISAIRLFGTRVWISDQAANEFVRNRKKVIVTSIGSFDQASAVIAEISKTRDQSISKLKSLRIFSASDLDEINSDITKSIDEAKAKIESAKVGHPNYLQSDEILDQIVEIFDGKVGPQPTPEELVDINKIAEQRFSGQVPPGYLDDGKPEDRKYGDYIMWSQTLEFAKSIGKPIILVTSEKKEDWWEVHSGRTVGPRNELHREASDISGQRVLIYQTDRFLQFAAEKAGQPLDKETVADLKDISERRSQRSALSHPSIKVSTVSISKDLLEQSGILSVEILKPIRNFTATVHLDEDPDWPKALIETSIDYMPQNCPDISIVSKVGSINDLNIHVHSDSQGTPLPVGIYRINYSISQWEAILSDWSPPQSNQA